MPPTREHSRTERLVFLHGFTQTHHHWHTAAFEIARRLRSTPTLTFVDLPGHGLAATDRTSIDAAGGALAQLAGVGTYVGYSMGGRFALASAVARPDCVERLVLIGATAGIVDPDARAERHNADADLATQIERDGVDTFITDWQAAPMFAGVPDDPAGTEHRRRNTANGLASSLRLSGTGSQRPLWAELPRLEMPILVIAGADDIKFTDIGRAMADAAPHAEFKPVANAGHAAHLEQPEATATLIAEWLVATC